MLGRGFAGDAPRCVDLKTSSVNISAFCYVELCGNSSKNEKQRTKTEYEKESFEARIWTNLQNNVCWIVDDQLIICLSHHSQNAGIFLQKIRAMLLPLLKKTENTRIKQFGSTKVSNFQSTGTHIIRNCLWLIVWLQRPLHEASAEFLQRKHI